MFQTYDGEANPKIRNNYRALLGTYVVELCYYSPEDSPWFEIV